jgi:uncharacterized membrane protein
VGRFNSGTVQSLERRLPALYFVFTLLLTTVLCWTTAPFFGPDEPNQSLRALALLHGEILPQMGTDQAGGQVDTGAVRAMDGMDFIRMRWEPQSPDFHDRNYGPVTPEAQACWANVRWSGNSEFAGFGNTATYAPGLYLPGMAGWRIGEAANLTIFASLRLARWLTALTAALLGWLALRWSGRGAWILLPGLLLPSELFLQATCSQDALLLPLAAVAVALIWRALNQRRTLGDAELALAAVLFALCAMAKPPYAALALLIFLPAVELKQRGWKLWLKSALSFAAVVIACGAWWRLVTRFGVDTADEADPARQVAFFTSHPLPASAAVFRGTAEAAWDFVHRGLYVVGWNDLLPHHGAALFLSLCLLAIVWRAPAAPVRSWHARILIIIAVILPLLGISAAEYLIWTPVGLRTVYGVQPRYWVPVLPAMMLLLTCWRRQNREPRRNEWQLLSATILLACIACTLPCMEARAFYRAGLMQAMRINLR